MSGFCVAFIQAMLTSVSVAVMMQSSKTRKVKWRAWNFALNFQMPALVMFNKSSFYFGG